MSKRKVKRRWESLPDEVAISIFIRLEPKDVLRCRCVAKSWRDVTLTPYFVDLHKQHGNAHHMIIVDKPKGKGYFAGYSREHYFLDEWWITQTKDPQKMYAHPIYESVLSQDGLLVMRFSICCDRIVIVNPICRENVKILISKECSFCIGNIYGVYFNTSLKEYCLLFDVYVSKQPYSSQSSTPKPPFTYKMLTLGPHPCLRDIENPYKDRYTYRNRDKRPVMVDCFLYWLVERKEGTHYYRDIMEFDTKADEFKLMSCPAPMTGDGYGRFGLDLLNIDGLLSLVQIVAHRGREVVEVNTWTLNDRASESWNFSQYDLAYKVYPESGWWRFETIDVRCGKILIRSKEKLYVCNIERGASKVLGSRKYNEYSTVVSHDIRLSSLNKCTPVIHIGNNIKMCEKCIKLEKNSESTSSKSAANKH